MTDDFDAKSLSPDFVPVCAIGASAGGVTALQSLFRQIPNDLGLAYVVILHLSPDQPSALSEILSVCTRMPVRQVDDGPTLEPNCVYVIPPDRELVIEGDSVAARPFSEPRGQRAPIDLFFRSIAAGRGDGVAIVLSGAGSDGALGVAAIKEAGGVIMVQEPAEAGFASMPQNAIASGVADFVAPIARLAERLAEVAHSKQAVRSLDMGGAANHLRRIVALLRSRTGHDFSAYKRATVLRRVLRRMQVCRTDTLADYGDYLLTTPEEAQNLFSDLLISVTMFFRDEHAFQALARQAIAPLFDIVAGDAEESVRVWVVGCATGEEAYSVAILLHEEMSHHERRTPFQIFATDLDEGSLATAREGRYPRAIEADVSEERLARFFIDEGSHYRVRKELRESVLFAKHSVLREPPFMRLDLVTCRNLLIYLERALQAQVCSIFHYGLKPGRFLFLGSAETVDVAADLFTPIDRHARIYGARPHAGHLLPVLPQFASPDQFAFTDRTGVAGPERVALPAALHVAALEHTAPASILVDEGQQILHLSPSAGRFILHSAGPVSTALPTVVRPELRLDLRLALTRALDQREPTVTFPTAVAFEHGRRHISMNVSPVPGERQGTAQALIFFLDGGPVLDDTDAETLPDARPDEVRRLYAELKASQEALILSRSGHDVSIQELRAANEELQSINEEYRSTAEELETSKEELQSINEELHTVNAELKNKLETISAAHSDLQNLTTATEIGTLFLDRDLRIRMFTPSVANLFNVTRHDVGRAITDFTHQLDYDGMEGDARSVLDKLVPIEREVRSRGGQAYFMRVRPYRTVDDRIDGAVVTFVDVTERAATEAALHASQQMFRTVSETAPGFIWFNDETGANTFVNRYFIDFTGRTADRIATEGWIGLVHPEDAETYAADYRAAVAAREPWQNRSRLRRADGAWRWVDNHARPLFGDGGRYLGHVGVSIDVDDAVRAEARRRESEARLQQFGEASRDVLWIRDALSLQWEYLTPAFETIYGLGRDPALRGDNMTGWLDLIVPEDREHAATSLGRVREGEWMTYEFRIRRPSDGAVRWISNTDFPIQDASGKVVRIGGIGQDVTVVKAVEEALAAAERRQRALLDGIPQLVWRGTDGGHWTWVSAQWSEFTGQAQTESQDLGWLEAVHPDDRAHARDTWTGAVDRGEYAAEYRIRRRDDDRYRWFQNRARPLRDDAGQIAEWLGTSTDIDDLRNLQARQQVLVTELQHRTFNLMGVIRSTADATIRSSGTLEEFKPKFRDRIDSLARVQRLLSRLKEGDRVTLDELIRSELNAAGALQQDDGRVVLDGPDGVALRSGTVQIFAMAIHELTTNALKYGALKQPGARLRVGWRVEAGTEDESWLHVDWAETGVAMSTAGGEPRGTGQGRTLIEDALPYQLSAQTTYTMTTDGVRCSIALPMLRQDEADFSSLDA